MAEFAPLFNQDTIEIVYPGMYTDAELVACEDIGAFWVKGYPRGYAGERGPWKINGKLVLARLYCEDDPVCVKCNRPIHAEWVRNGHELGCPRIEEESNVGASEEARRPRTETARGRRTEVHPIGLPGFEYKAWERTDDMPPDPWWVVDLGPGMNPLHLGHDEFLLIFREAADRVQPITRTLLADMLAWDSTPQGAIDLLGRCFNRIAELDGDLDRTQLALIESQNPGIDMEQVKAERAERGR